MRRVIVAIIAVMWAASPGAAQPDADPVDMPATFFAGPLNDDGTVNYVAALNDYKRAGLAPDGNAFVALIEVLPKDTWDQDQLAEMYRALEIEPPVEPHERFVTWDAFMTNRVADEARRSELLDRIQEQPWLPEQFPDAFEWIKANERALEGISRAVERSGYWQPIAPVGNSVLRPRKISAYIRNVRDATQALTARALCRAEDGSMPNLVADTLTIYRLGRHLTHGNDGLDVIIGMYILAKTRAPVIVVASEPQYMDQAGMLLREMPPLPLTETVYEAVDYGERCYVLDLLQQMRMGRDEAYEVVLSLKEDDPRTDTVYMKLKLVQESPRVKPVLQQEVVNSWFDRILSASLLEPYQKSDAELDKIWDELKRQASEAAQLISIAPTTSDPLLGPSDQQVSRAMAELVVRLGAPAPSGLFKLARQVTMAWELSRVALALTAFRVDHGRYPDRLDELVPQWIESVPDDFATGKTLNYDVLNNGFLLYSIGWDGEDDGGVDDLAEGDIVCRVELPAEE